MTDKIIKIDEHVNRRDLELILEVNKKAVEIETEVAEQNEEIIDQLNTITNNQDRQEERLDKQDEKIDKILKQSEDISKDLFKIKVLYVTGLLTLAAQIVSIFFKH